MNTSVLPRNKPFLKEEVTFTSSCFWKLAFSAAWHWSSDVYSKQDCSENTSRIRKRNIQDIKGFNYRTLALESVFITQYHFLKPGESELSRQRWMFEQQALQEYILLCCQNPTGGLLDKPGKSVPHHLDTHTHTCSLRSQMWLTWFYSCTSSSYVCMSSCVQVQRFLPHVLLPERPLHRAALWKHGPPSRDDPRHGGEQTGEAAAD